MRRSLTESVLWIDDLAINALGPYGHLFWKRALSLVALSLEIVALCKDMTIDNANKILMYGVTCPMLLIAIATAASQQNRHLTKKIEDCSAYLTLIRQIPEIQRDISRLENQYEALLAQQTNDNTHLSPAFLAAPVLLGESNNDPTQYDCSIGW